MGLDRLAKTLVLAHAELDEAVRPIDRRTRGAHLDGICRAAHALGIGMTPTAVRLCAQEALRQAGRRPAASGMNDTRKVWTASAAETCAALLEGLA